MAVCVLYTLLAGGLLARGIRPSMAEFAVPEVVLDSPHYHDAILWVYSHMIVIGLIVGVVGLRAESVRLQRPLARLLFAAHVYYTYLDFRSSDSALGNGLYQGPGSIVPALIGLVVTVLFARLSVCRARP